MSGWLARLFHRPVVVGMEQVLCAPGDTVLLTTRAAMSPQAREAISEQLNPIAASKGIKFFVFDGLSCTVVTGRDQ